ncbi:PDDEXK nuclease domain-containing protein [Roseateles sp. LYH14W]|uniref:YhcG family protein n=1 Tax=Pelomonas parva TaxID=3299032 RepID=A0ABW7EYZ5_9BURK
MSRRRVTAAPAADPTDPVVDTLYQDTRQRVEQARAQVLTQVNQALVLTYWHVGKAIKTQVLQGERATYGAGVLKALAERLTRDYGSGFSHSGLTRMAKLYDSLPDERKVATLSQQLSWSHFVELIKIDEPTRRDFYTELCAQSRWSVRTLRERMDGLLYERTAISRQPDHLIRQELAQLGQGSNASPALFLKDPYLLDFLDLKDGFTEKDLEAAILAELERFILRGVCAAEGVARVGPGWGAGKARGGRGLAPATTSNAACAPARPNPEGRGDLRGHSALPARCGSRPTPRRRLAWPRNSPRRGPRPLPRRLLGSDFAFMGRQKRIQVGGHDYVIDLLFFHRRLRRLVVIELKLGEFRPEHKGQVELYLKWLAKHEQQPGENPPIAIILCSDKDAEVVELMDLEKDQIHVAEYWLQLPPQEVLRERLHRALVEAKFRLDMRRSEVGDE